MIRKSFRIVYEQAEESEEENRLDESARVQTRMLRGELGKKGVGKYLN